MEAYELIKTMLSNYGVIGFAILFVVYVLLNPDKTQIIASWLWYPVGYIFQFGKRKYIQNNIEGHCSKSLKKITKELPDIDIPNLSIKWIKENDFQTLFEEGKAIVKLKFSTDETQNIIKATTIYVRDAFLKHSKPYMHKSLKKSIDFSITKKILLNITKNTRNIVSQYIDENRAELEEIRDQCSQIEEIDDNGLFTTILIRELDFYGTQLIGKLPTKEHFEETDKLLEFIYEIATRDYDDFTPLQFTENIFKIGVLLVAKIETYQKHGLAPYLRRIKLGLAKGINTFYLLAREDKVDILKDVAKKLLETGNFILINNPKEFKDTQNRDVIYYCFKVNKDSFIVQATKKVTEAIHEKTTINGVITKVKKDCLKVDVDGVEGIVNNQNLSIINITEAYKYFKENAYVELFPLAILANGIVEFSIKGTRSDPNNIIQSNYEIGKSVFATVRHCDDDFVKLELDNNTTIEGIAFRRYLTYSRFMLLNDKFPIGSVHEFVVNGHDFERNQIILKLKDLIDPWTDIRFSKNAKITFTPFKKTEKLFVGELSEGVEAILPFSELSWLNTEIESSKSRIRLGQVIECGIKDVVKGDKRIILSRKINGNNPYDEFYNLHKNVKLKFVVKTIDSYGICGIIDKKYDVYIPKYEQSWNGGKYIYRIGQLYDMYIKEVDKYGNKLIGTFKPIIKHPLESFGRKFEEGQILKFLEIKTKYNWGCVLSIIDGKRKYECLLFNGDISICCFINSAQEVLKNIKNLPLVIKEIDYDKNRIIMSLKELLKLNIDRIQNENYNNSYEGVIIGKKELNYIVLLKGIWIEAILETSKKYNIGDIVSLRPSRIGDDELLLTDE
jgi:small subunit ribosomal protein S1